MKGGGLLKEDNLSNLDKEQSYSTNYNEQKFLSVSLAHEIKNSLCAISGFAKLLKTQNDFNLMYIDTILDETKKCYKLVYEFLQLNKSEDITRDLVNINKILKETCKSYAYITEAKNIKITLIESYYGSIRGNVDEINRLLRNLLDNAIEAIVENGEIIISVSMFLDSVLIEVIDNGPGIEKEQMQMIFEPFFTTKNYGTGLGLAYCKKIIKSHGGEMDVDSKVGEGTRFRIKLPIAK